MRFPSQIWFAPMLLLFRRVQRPDSSLKSLVRDSGSPHFISPSSAVANLSGFVNQQWQQWGWEGWFCTCSSPVLNGPWARDLVDHDCHLFKKKLLIAISLIVVNCSESLEAGQHKFNKLVWLVEWTARCLDWMWHFCSPIESFPRTWDRHVCLMLSKVLSRDVSCAK